MYTFVIPLVYIQGKTEMFPLESLFGALRTASILLIGHPWNHSLDTFRSSSMCKSLGPAHGEMHFLKMCPSQQGRARVLDGLEKKEPIHSHMKWDVSVIPCRFIQRRNNQYIYLLYDLESWPRKHGHLLSPCDAYRLRRPSEEAA